MEYEVDVIMMAYNHENYIAQAIESVLKQKANFDFRILIGDDASSDGTQQIIREYASKHKNIVPILREKNVGATNFPTNSILLLNECSSEYIALIDGDDYWIDEYKLQKQYDFLKHNKDYSACFHKFNILEQETGIIKKHKSLVLNTKDTFDTNDILKKWFLQWSTVMFLRKAVNSFPDFCKIHVSDVTLVILISLYGKLKFLDEEMSVYRNHSGGVSKYIKDKSVEGKILEKRINSFHELNRFTNFKFSKNIKRNIFAALWSFKIRYSKNMFERIGITLFYFWRFNFFDKASVKSNLNMVFPYMYSIYKKLATNNQE